MCSLKMEGWYGDCNMTNYQDVLQNNPSGVLATQNGDRLDTRVLHSLFADGTKIYFCTSGNKPVYAQLMANPNASFCTYPPNYSPVLTLSGKVTFVDDMAFKARVMAESDMVKRNYQAPDNPVFMLFYLEVEEVKTYTYADGTHRERPLLTES